MIAGTSTELDDTLAFHEGDTWTGIPSFVVTPAPIPNLALVEMIFLADDAARKEAWRITSANADQISISDANTWAFVVPKQSSPLKAGKYVWAIRLTDDADPASSQHYAEGNILVKPKRRRGSD